MTNAPEQAVTAAGPVVEDPDRDLVLAARQGDDAALRTLYDRHYPGIYTLCKRALRDEAAARDAAEDVFADAFTTLDKFEFRCRFFSWLFRLTRTRIARTINKLDHERRIARDQPAAEKPAELVHSEREAYLRLVDAIQSLPPETARAFNLLYLAVLSNEETARILGISETALRMRLLRGRGKLLLQLEDG